jgi:hypothetical protein
MSLLLQAIEKGQDQGSIPCADGYRRRFDFDLPVRILKQEPKGIAVTGNGLRADMFMLNQMFSEKPLQ